MKINIKQLEAFVAVAELSNFRRAAEKLSTTQPNISSRISSLETQLDVKLIQRDSASVQLTPIGKTLLPGARDVLQSMDTFIITAGKEHLIEGTLSLGVTEMIAHSWLSRFLNTFKKRFEHIDVDLNVDLSSNLSTALANRTIDLALQNGPFAHHTSGTIELGRFPFVWVCASSIDINENELSLEALAQHPLLTHAKGTLPFEQLKNHLSQIKQPVRLVPCTHLAACMQMTCDGLGVACLPEAMVRSQLATGELTTLAYPWTPDPLAFSARYDKETAPFYIEEAASIARTAAIEFDSST